MRRILGPAGIFLLLTAWVCALGEIRVPEDYIRINDAVAAAHSGQTVLIGPGIFDRSTQDFPIIIMDGVSIEGNGKYQTLIDNGMTDAPAFMAVNIVTTSTLMSEFTIQNGDIPAGNGAGITVQDCTALYIMDVRFLNNRGINGGALYIKNSTVFVDNCDFEGNRAVLGGAVYLESAASAPIFQGSIFRHNIASQDGGAFYITAASGANIHHNTLVGNTAWNYGGALMIENSNAAILDNFIEENHANDGGGISLYVSNSPVQRNRFLKNSASLGGAIFSTGGTAIISNNTLSYNDAATGGAVYAAMSSTDEFLCNVIYQNKCAAIDTAAVSLTNSDLAFCQNTVANNNASAALGLYNSRPYIYNNIFAFNNGVGLKEFDVASDPDCQYNLFFQNETANYMDEVTSPLITAAQINSADNSPYTPQMNIVADPMFRDALVGDYHLRTASPVRDAGTFSAPAFANEDMDAENRLWACSGPQPDIGADEITNPIIIEPVIYCDSDADGSVTTSDTLILTFNRAMDSPTTITAADFYLPVAGDSLGIQPDIAVSQINPHHVIIHLGGFPQLTINGDYSDSQKSAGSPSSIDIFQFASGGLRDSDGLPASPLGIPGPNYTGRDITFSIGKSQGYAHWYASASINSGTGGYFQKTSLNIPILSSYYEGFIYMRPAAQYFGTTSAIAIDSDNATFIFDPFNPPTLTLSYDVNELDVASGEREENMRIFRLNTLDPMRGYFFELVPGALGTPQAVDTKNKTVSVNLTYLYIPRGTDYDAPVKIPFSQTLYDHSKGIFAVFPVRTFNSVQKKVSPSTPDKRVSLRSASPDIYRTHEFIFSGFEEDASGSVTLALRPPRRAERELFSKKSNAVVVAEALDADGITPIDISSTATITLNYNDRKGEVFHEDVVTSDGVKGSEPQLYLAALDPTEWTPKRATAGLTQPFIEPLTNVINGSIPPAKFHSGRIIIGALVDDDMPFIYNFQYSQEDWTFVKDFDVFDAGVPGSGPGFLSIACHTRNTFSYWENNPDEVPVVVSESGPYLYRARFPVDTDIYSQTKCPSFRLRINSQNLQLAASLRIMSYVESYASPSLLKPKTYELYFVPPNSAIDADESLNDLSVSLDLINLDEGDAQDATVYFRGVRIDRTPVSALTVRGTLATYTFTNGTDGWASGNAYPVFTPAPAISTGQSLYLGVADSNTFGYWDKDTGVPITTGTLYRARFFIYANNYDRQKTPDVRLRMSTTKFMYNSILDVMNANGADMSPTRIPREYAIYFYPEPELLNATPSESIRLAVDLINLSEKGERDYGIFIDTVILEAIDLPE